MFNNLCGICSCVIYYQKFKKTNKYNYTLLGIDTQDITVGNFICDIYKKSPTIDDKNYWTFIESLIVNYHIKYIFVTHHCEVESWALKKPKLEKTFRIKIFHNNFEFVRIMNSKLNTYKFCLDNNINVPKVYSHNNILHCNNIKYPILIKDNKGSGSTNNKIFENREDYINYMTNTNRNGVIIQQYIKGDEYTIDCLSNEEEEVLCVIPKKRLLVKYGAAFLSQTENNKDIIDFVKNVMIKSKNKYSVNVQVIIENETKQIYLIEVNPKWATSFPLSVEAGINLPEILIELQENPNYHKNREFLFKDNLVMLRHFTEYYM